MCTSPLIRMRAKRQDAGTYLASSSNWVIKSLKDVESNFRSYSLMRSYLDKYMDYQFLPCRKCDECKAKYASEWSIRCYNEFQVREIGCFLTLTIDDLKVKEFFSEKYMKKYCKRCVKGNRYIKYPINYTLCKGFLHDRLKFMRDSLYRKYGIKVRYFGCGEYGSPENEERPHYHMLLFGYNFPDKEFYKLSKKGYKLFLSEELSELWHFGLATVQDVDYRLCMYTAKYCMKKLTYLDEQSEFEHYYGREPEFLFMSKGNCQSNRCKFIDDIIKNCKGMKSLRDLNNPYCKYCDKTRGGIGYDWFLKYKDDVLKVGYISIDGMKFSIPNYYLKVLKLTDKEKYDSFMLSKILRNEELISSDPDRLSSDRLKARKIIQKNKLKLYKRE